MRIEEECFEAPWTVSSFYVLLRHRGRFGDTQGEIVMVVLEYHDKLSGYIVWEFDAQEQEGHILNIAVEKKNQRRGFGRELMNYAWTHLKRMHAKSCFLEVREMNTVAREFYESLGMIPVDRIERYYGNDDALIYQISFKST
jgi:ribosomal-protein-alanine N-acetyltransferase